MTETASEAGTRSAAALSRMQSHADLSVGAVLRSGLASVPDQHGRWLMAFLRNTGKTPGIGDRQAGCPRQRISSGSGGTTTPGTPSRLPR
jgi:hypothetical protein